VYGPRMGYEHVIPELYLRAKEGQDPLVVYSADHSRAFCYVQDAVELMVQLMRAPASNGQTFNVGNDTEEVTIQQLAERILRIMGLERQIVPRPAPHDPIRRRCPDMSKARSLLGYAPKVNLDTGLSLTIAWYERHPRPS
ncbi:MAG: GDP-mannose 4,6-dehydratase, partial [Verrucomicrobiae bacterium]|nr:GDP-mannose 4,6-dehydratase [Verrucomicrobiae bacterium]